MESILAHELGHIINKDSFISAGLWFTIRLFTIIQNILNRIHNMRQLMKSSEYQNSAANALRIAIEEYFKVPTTPLPELYASIRAVFGPDWQPAPIFLSSGIVNQGVYGAVNINGGIDVYTIGPGGMKETPQSYYQKFGTYDQNGIVGTVTIDQACRLGIDVTSISTQTPTPTSTPTTTLTPTSTPTLTPTPDPYASLRAVFGQDWQPAPIFISRGLVDQGVYGAVNINGGIDVYTIGPGGMKETPESYYQKFGTYDQNGIVGTVTIDQARRLGINV